MSAENNKQLVRNLFEEMNTGDIHRYLALLPDDYTHTVPGKSVCLPALGPRHNSPRRCKALG